MTRYSQGNQQDWLLKYFGNHVGVAVDVGANDGVFFSNTLALEERGWRVICIEPNPINHEALRRNRREWVGVGVMDYDGECEMLVTDRGHGPTMPGSTLTPFDGKWYDIFDRVRVPVRTLNSILEDAGVTSIDFLAMDIEGGEAHALRGLDIERYRPRLVTVEDNHPPRPAMPECREILTAHGYEEIHRVLDDVFFERKA